MRGLDGKRVVVAGGATGIGAATAERLAAEGVRVVVGDLNEAGAVATVDRVTAAGGTATAARFDLADKGSVAGLIGLAVDTYGGIDGLANVGADLSPETIGRDADLLEMDTEVWERTLRVNLLGYAHGIRAALPHFQAQGAGAIVNTSSGAAFVGEATRPAYAASKAGINALTRHVARRFGPENVRCNGVMPGAVLSETALRTMSEEFQAQMRAGITLTRLGRPDDLASAICFLLSEDASWVNGQVWNIDGGGNFRE
ncbi:MAG TPA: SDR family NAD(P)-dependent oxidoreductase [Planosporangium sp.]|jgi:NAD(P)-dependent dehydrogenase (short-subunit alcohol dehydrogenase family)|nr:SDR family NAD(P)-dependent oxidoreductase [Planosporangium sp.]